MQFQIRPFKEEDYLAIARIWSVSIQENWTVESIRWEDQRVEPPCRMARWVAEVEGEVVGFGEYSQNPTFYHPGKFDVNVIVLPDCRRQGIGSALYREVEEALAPLDPISLGSGGVEWWEDGLRFLAARGFVEKMRNWESQLDLDGFDPAPWQGLLEQVAAKGYQIRPYAELASQPEAAHNLYTLVTEVRRDVPSTEPWQDISFESWSKIFANPHFFPEGYFIGIKDGEWVGISALWTSGEPDALTTGLTAIKRAHRGTGLAKAMKVKAALLAWEKGFKRIRTWNESNNQRMLAINQQLGYARKPAWIMLTRQVQAEG